jgi:hypothetical protein
MRFPSIRRTAVLAVAAIGLVGSTGCFGSFQLTRKLYNFNKTVSPDKWVQELVFLGMNIVPVYSVVGLADALFANTVEFWTGTNPVASARTVRPDGTALVQTGTTTATGKTLVIDEVKDGETLSTTTISMPNDQESVTVETVFKGGRTVTKTITRHTDGSVTME